VKTTRFVRLKPGVKLLLSNTNLCRYIAGLRERERRLEAKSVEVFELRVEQDNIAVEQEGRARVGPLYKLNAVDPDLESAWFQPLNLKDLPLQFNSCRYAKAKMMQKMSRRREVGRVAAETRRPHDPRGRPRRRFT
jgi:hypothetical protein